MLRLISSVTILVLALSSWASAAEDLPLTIAASNVGLFRQGGSWYLSVNSAGKAELATEPPPVDQTGFIRRQFDISTEQLAEFRKALDDESFFEMEEEYGERVPDGSTTTLTVIRGGRVHSVKMRFLMNWVVAKDKEKLREPSRAVRLLMLVHGWMPDSEAARTNYERILEAAK